MKKTLLLSIIAILSIAIQAYDYQIEDNDSSTSAEDLIEIDDSYTASYLREFIDVDEAELENIGEMPEIEDAETM